MTLGRLVLLRPAHLQLDVLDLLEDAHDDPLMTIAGLAAPTDPASSAMCKSHACPLTHALQRVDASRSIDEVIFEVSRVNRRLADRLDVLTYNALCIYLRRLRVSCSLAMASALARLCSANGVS
jgi:hypothetical protein